MTTLTTPPEEFLTSGEPPAGFAELWQRYPWPDAPPVPEAPLSGRDQGGFELLRAALDSTGREQPVILEIGAEFGGSTRKFLNFGDTWVVSVDPWPDEYGGGSFPELKPFLGREHGMYELFQTFNFDYRSRLALVREWSPAGPLVVHDAGVPVDLIYIDGDHRYDPVVRDLTVASSMFPTAVLTGDDWLLESEHRKYEGIRFPVQTAVSRWAAVNHMHVETEGDSWVIDPAKPFNLNRPVPAFDGKGSSAVQFETLNRLKKMEKTLTGLDKDVTRVKSDVDNVKSNVRLVKENVRNVKVELRETKRHVSRLDTAVRRVNDAVRNAPSRRLARKVRSVLPGQSGDAQS